MKRYQFGGFSRISKAAARKMYDAGRVVWACPVKMRPDGYFSTACPLRGVEEGRTFEQAVNAFEFYNCNGETGKYTAFYALELGRA